MEEPEEMGGDITFEHMLPPHEEPSEVKKFYEGTHIFITGGTGLLGVLLIQKLIRSCPDLSKIYLLMRPKRGKCPDDRLDDMLKDPVFEKMMAEQTNFYDKIQLIDGNCEKSNLGLNAESKQILLNNVNIVFHLAEARFEDRIKRATQINIKATQDMIDLAKSMQNLKAFVFVSSAFSQCIQNEIDEQFYQIHKTPEKLFEIVNSLNDDELHTITPQLLGRWPNTYTFTKAIAENVIKNNGKSLSIAIVRPSMVVSTCREPLSGWANNYYGPVGMVMAASLGLMRSFQAEPNNRIDLVPADYVVNSMIVCACQIGKIFYNDTNNEIINNERFDDLKTENNIPIFNFVSSPETPITWNEFMSLAQINVFRFPTSLVIWYYCFTLNPNYYIHKIYTIFLHYVPAYIVDAALFLIGKKPMMIRAYKKLHYFQDFFSYFSTKQYTFKNKNTQTLWKKLNSTDRRLFHFSLKDFYWNEYCFTFVRGARVYLLKESMDTLPQAKKRYRKLKFIHYFFVTTVWFLIWILIRMFL